MGEVRLSRCFLLFFFPFGQLSRRIAATFAINQYFLLDILGPSSMASLPSAAFGSIYQKLWAGLSSLEQDPHPGASQMAKQVMDYIRDQVGPFFYCTSHSVK